MITQRQHYTRIIEKNSKNLPIYAKKRYFKNGRKHSKRFDHVIEDVMPLFLVMKKIIR